MHTNLHNHGSVFCLLAEEEALEITIGAILHWFEDARRQHFRQTQSRILFEEGACRPLAPVPSSRDVALELEENCILTLGLLGSSYIFPLVRQSSVCYQFDWMVRLTEPFWTVT